MKFSTFSLFITILISFNVMINAVPIGTKRQDQSASLEIQGPTKDSTWVAGRSEAITWKTASNNPVDILLSKEGSSDAIVVAKGLNGFQGSYVYSVPTSLFSTSSDDEPSLKWKIIIKDNGQIFSTSDDFIILATTPTEPVNSVPPSALAMSENHWAATASISLIGADGKPLSLAEPTSSAATSQVPSLSILLLLITLGGVLLGL